MDGGLVGELALDRFLEFFILSLETDGEIRTVFDEVLRAAFAPELVVSEVVDVEGEVHPRVDGSVHAVLLVPTRNETADMFFLDGRRLGVVTHQVQAIVMFTSLEAL